MPLHPSQIINKLLFLSGDIYLSFGISLSNPIFPSLFATVSELFCKEVLETFVILSAVLLPIKLPISSTDF